MKKKKLLIVFGVCLIIWSCFFVTDFICVKNMKQPIFCISMVTYKDGGSAEYFGLGYKVIKYYEMSTNIVDFKIGSYFMRFQKPFIQGQELKLASIVVNLPINEYSLSMSSVVGFPIEIESDQTTVTISSGQLLYFNDNPAQNGQFGQSENGKLSFSGKKTVYWTPKDMENVITDTNVKVSTIEISNPNEKISVEIFQQGTKYIGKIVRP